MEKAHMDEESMWATAAISRSLNWKEMNMARLPLLDSDEDRWGAVLNEFLLVSHHADGTLQGTIDVVSVRDAGAQG